MSSQKREPVEPLNRPSKPETDEKKEPGSIQRTAEGDLHSVKIQELTQNIVERKNYARRLYIMLCVWLIAMLIIVSSNALGKIPGTLLTFALSDAVVITIVTTTTANIAAFFLVVTKYLFPTAPI